MGIVKRQGIKQSIVTYVGVAIGIANMLLIYPAFLKQAELGIITYVRETAAMLSLFVFLGSTELIVRFFPHFKSEENKNNGFLFLLLAIVTVGCALLTVGTLLFRGQINAWFGGKEEPLLYLQFVHLILPFTVLIAYGNMFQLYASNFQRIVVPTIFAELLPKIGLPLLVLAFYLKYISFEIILYGSLCIYGAILLGQIWYVRRLGQLHLRPDFRLLKKPTVREMTSYSVYGFVGSLGSRFSSEFVNFFLIGTLTNLTFTGIYTIAYSIANVIDVPRKAISRIVAPLLADKWKDGKLAEIGEIYQKSSLNQLIAGLWVFGMIWVCIDEIFRIMPNGETYAVGKYVVLLLGTARIVDMATGVNSEILSFSKFYRYNFYLILFMAVVHIGANLLLIPRFSLMGVAIATLISLTLFNLVKFLVLRWKLNMQPFTAGTWQTLLFAVVGYGVAFLIPSGSLPLLAVFVKTAAFTAVFFGAVYAFKVSPEINQLAEKAWSMATGFLKKK